MLFIILLIPMVFFQVYLGLLRAKMYWRMVKSKDIFDYFILVYQFQIIVIPIKYPPDFSEKHVLNSANRYNTLVKYFYTTMIVTAFALVAAYRVTTT
ncbi:MAG TPA: hypothetical protein VGD22_11660 [Sphingobacteriaceae bacterium]